MAENLNFNAPHGSKPTVLIAPLDWGLGHATRCIPVVIECLNAGFEVIIAATGPGKYVLATEFPALEIVELPAYAVKYPQTRNGFLFSMLIQSPKILMAINKENKWLLDYAKRKHLDLIISDNRYGLFHPTIKSVFITHQLNIISGLGLYCDRLLRRINYYLISKFNECWVPDFKGEQNLAGRLSHPNKPPKSKLSYVGPLTRFIELNKKQENRLPEESLLIILSGPEPQRSLLEESLLSELSRLSFNICFVRGLPQGSQKKITFPGLDPKKFRVFDYLDSQQLAKQIEIADIVVCRSGYSSIMDLLTNNKRCIFIPTPGQTEQEYLADYHSKKGNAVQMLQSKLDLAQGLIEVKKLALRNSAAIKASGLPTALKAATVAQ